MSGGGAPPKQQQAAAATSNQQQQPAAAADMLPFVHPRLLKPTKFGLLDVNSVHRLKEKRKTIQNELVPTGRYPTFGFGGGFGYHPSQTMDLRSKIKRP